MEFYAAVKKNEMLSLDGKWIELENIILSEVSLAQKTKNRMFSLICRHQIKGKHNKGIGLGAHDKSEYTQGRYEDR
jgi:hypothetical protein